jgi:ABC-type multidrug transport system permease subunit
MQNAVPFFHHSDLGLKYRPGLNPADFLVAAVASQHPDDLDTHFRESPQFFLLQEMLTTAASEAKIEDTLDLCKEGPTDQDASSSSSAKFWVLLRMLWGKSRYPSTFSEQVSTLLRRNFVFAIREPRGIFSQIFRHVAVGLFFGSLYRGVPGRTPQHNSHNIASLLFFSVFFLAVGHQHSIPILFSQRPVWQHEGNLGLYSTRALYVSQLLERWPPNVFCVGIFGSIVYFCCGLNQTLEAFSFFLAMLLLASLVSLSLCELVASVAPSTQAAITVFLPLSFFFVVSGGFIVLIPSLPSEIRDILPAVSYIRWAFQVCPCLYFSE